MKILMVTMGLDIGGAETHIVELSKELKRRGHSVFIASNGGGYVAELENFGIKHYTVPMHTKNPLCVLKAKKLLTEIISRGGFDIVHAHARIPAFIAGKICRRLKVHFVTTAHWVFTTKFGLKYITDWGEKTIAVSEDIKKYLMDNYGTHPKDITVTINGIDPEKFSKDIDFSDVAEEFNIKENSFRIVHVSRIDESREAVAFILTKIMPRILEKIPDAELVIVGGGNKLGELKSIADKCHRIHLAGPRTDINKFTAMADLFVGVSRAALEAMCAGKSAIIAGNEGEMGLFTPEKKEESILGNFCCRGQKFPTEESVFSSIMEYYNLSDGEKAENAVFCQNVVYENYSVEKMAEDAETAYRSALGE